MEWRFKLAEDENTLMYSAVWVQWTMCILEILLVFTVSVPAVNQNGSWMEDLLAKLLLGLSDNWKILWGCVAISVQGSESGSYSQMNPDMHSAHKHMHATTRPEGTIKYVNSQEGAGAFCFSHKCWADQQCSSTEMLTLLGWWHNRGYHWWCLQ